MMRPGLVTLLLLVGLTGHAQAAVPTTDVEIHTPGGEPEIAVNPKDPRNLVVGNNVDGVSYSRDGGATWKDVTIPNIGDNVLAVEPDGTFLYSSISGTIWASRDGGATWARSGNWVGAVAESGYSLIPELPYPANVGGGDVVRQAACDAPAVAGAGPVDTDVPPSGPGVSVLGCDRPWLVTDPASGRAYLSFSVHNDASGGTGGEEAEQAGGGYLPWEFGMVACRGNTGTNSGVQCGRQYVAASGDGGRTWSAFRPMDSEDYPWAVTNGWSGGPAAAFGTLATAYIVSGTGCISCVVFETSTDDGATWTRHKVAPATFLPASSYTTTLNFSPYTAADPSRRGHYAVMVFDAAQTRMEVYVTSDSGVSWRSVTLAEPGAGVNRWVPWVAYGPSGALGVTWATSYADGSYDRWAAVAPRGDTDFMAPVRLSSGRSPGPVATGGDDASDVALTRDTLYAAWGDQRGGPPPAAWFGSATDHVGSYRFRTACGSRRAILIHPRGLRGARVHRIAVYVDGRRIATQHGPRRAYQLTLRGRPRGAVHVRLVITTAGGRTITDRRTYHPCTGRR